MKPVTGLVAALVLVVAGVCKAETVAIVGGRVATLDPAGTIEGGTVVIEDGRIAAVGLSATVPPNATVIDAAGKWVTPGVFAALSVLGAVEIELEDSTNDTRVEEAGFNAAYDISFAINPRAAAIAVTRIEGVTRAGVMPLQGDGVFAGLGALIHLGEASDLVTRPRAFMVAALGSRGGRDAGGSRAGAMILLAEALEEARRYRDDPDPGAWEGSIPKVDAVALVPVIEGRVPLVVRADRASDITQALRLADRFADLRIILRGGGEAWMVADDLAAAGVPVILQPLANLPYDFDRLAQTRQNAARLVAAGVTVAFADGADGHNPRLILQHAGNAVASGLEWEAALAAITLNPARIFGVDQEIGSLTAGKVADVVIWDGDPLEVMSSPDAVFIEGVPIPLESRQTKLRDRYRDLDGDWPFAYRR